MMPEEWPIAVTAADGSTPARLAGRGRLPTVRRDFFLDPAARLSEQERALMTAMLHALVGDVAAAIRAALPGGRLAANDAGDSALIEELTVSGLLDEPELMALLLRKADEERIAIAARARSGRREARTLQALVSHDQGSVAGAAMALILARGRRRDRFNQSLIGFDDLQPSTAEVLVNAIAAGLRRELAASRNFPNADLELAEASQSVLAERNDGRGIDSLTRALVQHLEEAGAISDTLVLAAASEGELTFVAAVLALRGGLTIDTAVAELLSGKAKQIMALLRVTKSSRELASGLLASIGDLLGVDDGGSAIALFASMSEAEVEGARAWMITSRLYREALERLGQRRG